MVLHTVGSYRIDVIDDSLQVVVSDYPAQATLQNLLLNVDKNVPTGLRDRITVQGHQWGALGDEFSRSNEHSFGRILAADCFWMPGVHEELVQSMLHFLSFDSSSRILAIGGFHTGRAKLAAFFDIAIDAGLEVEEIFEEDADGLRRPWVKVLPGGPEDPIGRKRWLVIAILRRPVHG